VSIPLVFDSKWLSTKAGKQRNRMKMEIERDNEGKRKGYGMGYVTR